MPSHPPLSEPEGHRPERRNFFRIEDRIGLEIRKLPPTASPEEDPFNDDHLKSLKHDFRRLDQDVKSQLAGLAEQNRLVAGLLKSLNAKVDTLARIMAFEQNPLQPEHWQEVTLSEGGVAFTSSHPQWHKDDLLAIRMTLPPELFQPQAVARVVVAEPDDSGATRVRTEFVRIQEGDRQQIARHVMRWQIRQRQKG